jgi:Potassium-transporting ATPase A subunit
MVPGDIAGPGVLAGVLRLQRFPPGGPDPRYLTTPMTPDLAANTAVSFTTTTTWQAYGGETTMKYAGQLAGLAAQSYLDGDRTGDGPRRRGGELLSCAHARRAPRALLAAAVSRRAGPRTRADTLCHRGRRSRRRRVSMVPADIAGSGVLAAGEAGGREVSRPPRRARSRAWPLGRERATGNRTEVWADGWNFETTRTRSSRAGACVARCSSHEAQGSRRASRHRGAFPPACELCRRKRRAGQLRPPPCPFARGRFPDPRSRCGRPSLSFGAPRRVRLEECPSRGLVAEDGLLRGQRVWEVGRVRMPAARRRLGQLLSGTARRSARRPHRAEASATSSGRPKLRRCC